MPTVVRSSFILLLVLVGLAMGPTVLAGAFDRGALLAASCEGCHGPGGHSPGAIPDISGHSEDYLRTTLEEFRAGERASTVMARHVKGYTEEEVAMIAAYFGAQN